MDQSQKACKKKRNSVKIMLKDLHYKIVTKSLSNRVSTWNHFFYYDKTLAFFAELNLFLICSSKTKMCQKAVQPPVCIFFLTPKFLVKSILENVSLLLLPIWAVFIGYWLFLWSQQHLGTNENTQKLRKNWSAKYSYFGYDGWYILYIQT